jgi:hypothetical protein
VAESCCSKISLAPRSCLNLLAVALGLLEPGLRGLAAMNALSFIGSLTAGRLLMRCAGTTGVATDPLVVKVGVPLGSDDLGL